MVATKRFNLTYALKDNTITHISEVERGLKCGCICPACGENLIARKGQRVMHHFAHQATKNCEYGYESSLHLAAKEILSQTKRMVIPSVYIHFPDSPKQKILLCEEKEISIDHVELEHRFNNIIPDVVAYTGTKQLFIEIFVTHCVDEEKLDKLRAADISTIEIDLSKIDHSITKEELTSLLTEKSEVKHWKYNSLVNKYLKKFYQAADRKRIIPRGFTLHVDGCPITARSWLGKSYANVFDDCSGCQYCIFHSQNYILCSGRQRISSIQDFKTPADVRIKDNTHTLSTPRKYVLLPELACPYCGEQLTLQKGRYGYFVRCTSYPQCEYTASVNEYTGEIITYKR